MKRILALIIFMSFANTASAMAAKNNTVIKKCLATYNYNPNKFHQFKDWNKASKCYHNWKKDQKDQETAELRNFLKENPWYKGRNWQWEQCAKDNRCTKRYSWWVDKNKNN